MAEAGKVRCGIGGWTFEPWRGVFYPPKWPHARELEYASRHLTAIEINGTYYSSFKPDTWAKWRASTCRCLRSFLLMRSRLSMPKNPSQAAWSPSTC